MKLIEDNFGTMHDNILPFLESNKVSSHTPNGCSFLQDIYSQTTSSQQQALVNVSPFLPGNGSITPKITRMLGADSDQLSKSQLPVDPSHTLPYSLDSSATLRNMIKNKILTHDKGHSQKESVHNSSGWEMSTASVHNTSSSEMSVCSGGSISPSSFEYQASSDSCLSVETSSLSETPSSVNSPKSSGTTLSVDSSPLSDAPFSTETSPLCAAPLNAIPSPPSSEELSPLTSPETRRFESLDNDAEQPKKKARTNYTNEQIQTLLKIFHETPYPDSEMMENIGKDLGIPERKVKIWFQNKRARWRRRVNDKRNSCTESLFPMSPVPPYAYVPTGHMMTSSAVQNVSGYYPWMQSCFVPNKNLNLHGQFSRNQVTPNLQGANGAASVYPFVSLPATQYSGALSQQRMTSFLPTLPSPQYSGALSPHRMTSEQTKHPYQYSSLNASTYSPGS